MANVSNRYSSHSNASAIAPQRSTTPHHQPTQVSTQTLLTALHTAYSSSKPYLLDIGTSLVVNTWITAATVGPESSHGGTVDFELARRAYEHARRRTEDGCIVLGSLHDSTPSLFAPFVASMPFALPSSFHAAITALRPFLNCVTPQNPSTSKAYALAATFTLTNESGQLKQAVLRLSQSGIDVQTGLINIPREHGYRAFDALYYLLSSASTASEREFLGLKAPSAYSLLKRSETYDPPAYLPTADDSASAEDFRAALKTIGISGSARRDLVSVLVALLQLGETLGFVLDEEELDNVCEDAAGLLGVDPELLVQKCSTSDREVMMAGLYEALIDWVIAKANGAIADEITRDPPGESRPGAITPATVTSESEDSMTITVVEIPGSDLGKAVSLKTVFDDSEGINAEMKEDGVNVNSAGHSVIAEMKQAVASCEPDLGIMSGPTGRERELERDRREQVLDKLGHEAEDDSFLRKLLYPVPEQGISLGQNGRFDLMSVVGSSRVWFHLSIHPTDASPSTLSPSVAAWSAGSVSRQLRAWRLPEWANRRNKQIDFTADYDWQEFCNQYKNLGCKDGRDGIESFILERGWSNGEVVIGKERVWMREGAYMEAETMRDMIPPPQAAPTGIAGSVYNMHQPEAGSAYNMHQPEVGSAFFGSQYGDGASIAESRENLLRRNQSGATYTNRTQLGGRSLAPTATQTVRSISGGDYGLGNRGDMAKGAFGYENELDPELGVPKHVTEQPITVTRRLWAGLVWALTFWIPSFVLRYIGQMKRPDIRMAWREKLILVLLIFLLNAFIIFYIIIFGRLLCPNFDKAWNKQQVGYHQGTNDFYVAVRGRVYDISNFWQIDHSNIISKPVTSADMLPLAGKVVDAMFPIPLYIACPGLVAVNSTFQLVPNPLQEDPVVTNSFPHTSGPTTPYQTSPLVNPRWYNDTFMPKMKHYYVGELVTATSAITTTGGSHQHYWFTMNNNVYDLSDYFYTRKVYDNAASSRILPESFAQMVQAQPGSDLTDSFNKYAKRNPSAAEKSLRCLNNQFYIGKTDFRDSPRCQVNNYILLGFTIILCVVILIKFLAALQLGSKRRPAAQDKFVICQVPAYTEGEDHLRKGLDSLTALAYDNKRKLICVICDGMIVGGGNDRPTPKIVLDILGVDPKIDPPALPFRSVGQGSEQLNYGKVYSGLYEYEGNVVPYVVVVKVGKESEQTKAKPGNRGKRDSQILLMSFLNRVHHRSPMSPLELEMFHQINNIIGVDPELYEYLFMVDADTSVKEDALNRLVASCANDAKIAGICGETSLENEERSWWTMIQVYEYYISHHLAKSFESLFGSVTCLPGCFCMYRLRTVDKGKPLIISDKVVKEYADCDVDTLHKKNLLALGEDRYLTTLMTKHFPHMSYKFIPDAYAQTAAPETWSILLSQRRRWINSTIHNLVELMFLKDLCGFCCFSMRFVVFIDLFGTIILPATCVYLGYLIYRVSSGTGQFPLISVIMIAAVYGLQAVIFIIKRQWQHIGWMIIYIIAFPVYSFVLPIYAFWKQDDFSWGNTRVVIGEKGNKQIVATTTEDEGFDPRSIPLQRWDDYAAANNLPGRRGVPEGGGSEKGYGYEDGGYEMDDMRSVYSAAKPASTILTGFKSHGPGSLYMPPQSPAPFSQRPDMQHRGSNYSDLTPYTDHPTIQMQQNNQSQSRLMSLGNMSDAAFQYHHAQLAMQQQRSPYASTIPVMPYQQSAENLLGGMGSPNTPPLNRAGTRSPFAMSGPSRPGSNMPGVPDFQTSMTGHGQPSDAQVVEAIQAVLSIVDMDTVTKKQVRSLVETRLQTTFTPQRREFLDERIDIELANM